MVLQEEHCYERLKMPPCPAITCCTVSTEDVHIVMELPYQESDMNYKFMDGNGKDTERNCVDPVCVPTSTSLLVTTEQSTMQVNGTTLNKKQVCFNLVPEVHVIRAWDFAYRAARKGMWEECARDRYRFHKRIWRTAEYLDPILCPEHRAKIYRSRFSEE